MTLRQVLNKLQGCVTEEFTEEMLLDTEIKVEVPSATGNMTTTCGTKEVEFKIETRYSSLQHKQVPVTVSPKDAARIVFHTTMSQ